jgi:hypothetical protein
VFKKIIQYYTEGIPSRSDFPEGFLGLFHYLKKIYLDTPPGISRLLKIQPVISLISGIFVIFLIRRGFEYVPLVIICLVLTFVYLAFRLYIQNNNSGPFNRIAGSAVMFSVNYMLLFILPFYFESMTIPSRNMLFGIIIIALAVLSNWNFLLKRFILKSVLASSIYYALVFFSVLNFIFPIIFGLRNIWSLAISGGIGAVSAVFVLYPQMTENKNRKNILRFVSGILLSLVVLWFGRSFIPPAPLELKYATACEGVEEHNPNFPFDLNYVNAVEEIYFYTAIYAPKGLSEGIDHVWYYNSERLMSIRLSEITGGRNEGYRTWSKHALLEGVGKYTIEVWTDGGQFLGEGSFTIASNELIPATDTVQPAAGSVVPVEEGAQ